MKEKAGRSSQAAGRLGFRCGVPPRQTQTDNDASGSPQRVAVRLDRTALRPRNQAMKNYAAICRGRRGRPGRRPAVRFGFKPHSGIMTGFYERRLFLGFRCGVPPRQTQTDNDASGNPQRVAVRLDRTALRHRNQAMKNYAAICRGSRGRPGRRPAVRFGFKPHSGIMTGFYERRLFLGFRCGVPPRQTQTDNDASGNPQRVAGRPPLPSVQVTVLHRKGQNGLGRPLRPRNQAIHGNAVYWLQKNHGQRPCA